MAASLNATISSPVADRCAIAHYVGLANANVTYDWTRGNVPGAPYRITKDGGTGGNQWRIHKDDVTYYLGTEVVFHPCLVATWTAQNGATGLPVIGVSRTGNIERVRKAQRDFVAQDFKAIMFDSRGCERGWEADPLPTSYDHVHMTVAGHQMLASRFAAAFAATRP